MRYGVQFWRWRLSPESLMPLAAMDSVIKEYRMSQGQKRHEKALRRRQKLKQRPAKESGSKLRVPIGSVTADNPIDMVAGMNSLTEVTLEQIPEDIRERYRVSAEEISRDLGGAPVKFFKKPDGSYTIIGSD
jgi:tRNA G37 N-methylase Trm5